MTKKTGKKKKTARLLKILLALLLAGVILVAAGFGALCISEEHYRGRQDLYAGDVILVPGSQVYQNGDLSLNLTYRLQLALEAWQARPRMICVCGGQGSDEPMPEAVRMKQWLCEHGVPEEQILTEDTSTNTLENMRNARALMPDVSDILLVTSDFHVPRATAAAESMGFTVHTASARISENWWLRHHTRELLAWVKWEMYDLFGWEIGFTVKMGQSIF